MSSERIRRFVGSVQSFQDGGQCRTPFTNLRLWIIEKLANYRLPVDISFGKPHGLTILPYGSTVAGTSLANGDADFAVAFYCISNPCKLIEIERHRQEQVLIEIFSQLRKNSEIGNTQRIFRARVPVIKLSINHNCTSQIDLCCSVNGVQNSLLLRHYMESSPRLHSGCLLAKLWGRSVNILNSHRGWISPYALTILYIFFLQSTGTKFDLQKPASLDDILHACHLGKYSEIDEFNLQLPIRFFNISDIERDIAEFFRFYSHGFDFDSGVIDIRQRSPIFKKDDWIESVKSISTSDRWNLLGHENIFIRDPFEDHNLGRSVDFLKSEQIREVFRVASKQKDSLFFLSDTTSH